ncbi:MAG: sigma-70 family RNA polymerase sigma factor [Planctomycetes bacterium]|nr:sigma-70 family RNA polymerase sigma factor [Planctomycetota bacterium]
MVPPAAPGNSAANRRPATGAYLEELLEHADWLRELARRLVRDPDAADELAQRTWLAVLQRPSVELESARRWLAAVMRNFVREDVRAGERRMRREESVARQEALPSTLDVLERASLQRRIADAVLELDEPYRTTILLRFFDRLPPREVARLQRVPVDTVRTRTTRALGMLRARLDREFGDRGTWSAWVFAWLRPETSLVAPFGVALFVDMKLKLALLLLSVAAALAVWIGSRGSSAADEHVGGAPVDTPSPALAVGAATGVANAPLNAERTPALASNPAPDSATSVRPAVAAPTQRGRVVDDSDRAVADVRVVVSGTELATRTKSDGTFELAASRGKLVVDDERWTTLYSGVGDAPDEAGTKHDSVVAAAAPNTNPPAIPTTIVVAPRVRFGGRVTDVDGVPLGGARLSIELPDGFRTRLASVLDRSERRIWTTESAPDGTYAFDDAPGIVGAELSASLAGFLPHREALVGPAQGDVWITLVQPGLDPHLVRGRVVDPRGRPVEDARVGFGIDTTESDEDGFFAFQKDDPRSFGARFGVAPTWLAAVKRGYLPARFEPELVGGAPRWPDFVVLRLGESPLEIRGRVVDAAHEPLANVRVWVENTTFFGAIDGEPTTMENVLAGESAFWRFVRSDERGEFVLDGLLDQEYELGALLDDNLLRADPVRVRAGASGVELVLPTDRLYPRVAGRLVSRAGTPVANARVALMCDAYRSKLQGQVIGTSHANAQSTTTDADGRFEFRGVPKSLVYLRIDGDELLPLEYGRYDEGDPRFANVAVKALPVERIEDLEIVVALRCHLRVELADPEFADEFAVLDAAGEPLEISTFEGSGRQEGLRSAIVDGRSNTTGAPDFAATLVLFKANVEVARRPLALTPGAPRTERF